MSSLIVAPFAMLRDELPTRHYASINIFIIGFRRRDDDTAEHVRSFEPFSEAARSCEASHKNTGSCNGECGSAKRSGYLTFINVITKPARKYENAID